MSATPESHEYRVLIVDDTPAIHKNYQTILATRRADGTAELEASIFGYPSARETRPRAAPARFVVDSAFQGQQALEMVHESLRTKSPYALAFVDVRMPPGWDGIETVSRIWKICPELEVTICTAYSDLSLTEITDKLVRKDRFLILKKPFDPIVVLQIAYSLTEKWRLRRDLNLRMDELKSILNERAQKLAAVEGGSTSNPNVGDLLENLRNTRKLMKDLSNKFTPDR